MKIHEGPESMDLEGGFSKCSEILSFWVALGSEPLQLSFRCGRLKMLRRIPRRLTIGPAAQAFPWATDCQSSSRDP